MDRFSRPCPASASARLLTGRQARHKVQQSNFGRARLGHMSKSKTSVEHVRCGWASAEPIYVRYHDEEWGVPVYDNRVLFEFLVLEGAQAGLSWLTILKKREAYRRAFDELTHARSHATVPPDRRANVPTAGNGQVEMIVENRESVVRLGVLVPFP